MKYTELTLSQLDAVSGGGLEQFSKPKTLGDLLKYGPIIIHGPNDPNGPIGGWPNGRPPETL